jgi:integrase/recombinase XerD
MADLEEFGERFKGILQVQGFSPKTINLYGFYLKGFFQYLRDVGVEEVVGVLPSHVRDFLFHVAEKATERGITTVTISQLGPLTAVKSFFRLLQEEGFLVGDPARRIPYPKRPQRLPRAVLTVAEIKKLLNAPDTTTAIGYRDRTMLEVFYSTGIRRFELESLKVEDLDLSGGYLRVNQGKGGKDRVVPLGTVACRYVESYLKAVRPLLVKDPANLYLFVSQYGNRFSNGVVWRMVKQYGVKAGLGDKVHPHALRHTCATLMLKNRASIRHVQELLGHTSLDSTQVYTHVSVTDLKEAHKKFHPRERDGRTL